MDFLKKVWEWFNGNKTKLGALIFGFAQFWAAGEVSVFGLFDLHAGLMWLAAALGTVGVAHMVAKKGAVQ
jgi:hypothetical protein